MTWEDIIKKSKLIKMDDSMSFFLAVEIDVDYIRTPFPKGRPFDESPSQEIIDRNLESELHRELADEIESQLLGQDFSIRTVIEEQDDDGNEKEATIEIKGEITGVSANR